MFYAICAVMPSGHVCLQFAWATLQHPTMAALHAAAAVFLEPLAVPRALLVMPAATAALAAQMDHGVAPSAFVA